MLSFPKHTEASCVARVMAGSVAVSRAVHTSPGMPNTWRHPSYNLEMVVGGRCAELPQAHRSILCRKGHGRIGCSIPCSAHQSRHAKHLATP